MQKNSIENFTLDPDLEGFYDSLKNKNTVKTLKQSLLKTHKHLKNRFIQNDDIRSLIHLHSIITDLTIASARINKLSREKSALDANPTA